MNLALETRIYSFGKDKDLYNNDGVVRFEANQLERGDMQICIPLTGCKVEDSDELIITLPNRAELIAQLLKGETAEKQLMIIAAAKKSL